MDSVGRFGVETLIIMVKTTYIIVNMMKLPMPVYMIGFRQKTSEITVKTLKNDVLSANLSNKSKQS